MDAVTTQPFWRLFWTLFIVLTYYAQPSAGQPITPDALRDLISSGGARIVASLPFPDHLRCELRVADIQEGRVLLPAPIHPLGKTSTATFNVTYNSFPAEYQAAVQRAIDTWASLLTSSQTINVTATYEANPNPNVLASAGPTSIYGVTFNSGTLPLWLGVALAEKVVNSNANGTSADITISVNSTFANWHTGTGTPPSDKFDLESVILHELGHGLNFFALSEYNTGTGVGTITFTSGSFTGQGIFDYFMYDAATGGNALRNTAAYANASTALGSAFTGGSVYLNGTNGIAQNGNARPQIYAPNPYNAGSSLSHLNETTFNGSLNALMTYAIAPGEMARTPGPVACGIMADMVWTVNQAACTSLALPVEMVAFDAVAEGSAALLRWQTASETDNAGWAVERRAAPGDDAWRQVAFVAGRGTTSEAHAYEQRVAGLLPGRHTFRLRQIDLDGRVSLTPEVEVVLYVDGTGLLSAAMPNPTRGPAHLSVAVRVTQHVRVEALDGLGRRVAVLFEGDVVPESPQQVAFDPAGLPAGLYLIRAIGTHFVSTRPVAVVR